MKFREDNLQMACATILDLTKHRGQKILWCHVPNERKTTIRAGARFKKKGVKRGVPDILIFSQSKGFSGLAIELKVGKTNPTKDQKKWLARLSENNWECKICRSIDEFQIIIKNYFEATIQ